MFIYKFATWLNKLYKEGKNADRKVKILLLIEIV